jgi:hypothetical protein
MCLTPNGRLEKRHYCSAQQSDAKGQEETHAPQHNRRGSTAETATNFEKASRPYEQERSTVSAATALEMYVRRWLGWVKGGMQRSYKTPNTRKHEKTVRPPETTATNDHVFGSSGGESTRRVLPFPVPAKQSPNAQYSAEKW